MSGDVGKTKAWLETSSTWWIVTTKTQKRLKFFHVNCQSIMRKRSQLELTPRDIRIKTIYGFTRTWLKQYDDKKL